MADANARPNIRIEIKNNVTELMDVDEATINISEEEEGEISDKNDGEEEVEESAEKNDDTKPRDIWAKFDNGTTTKTNSDAKRQIESVYTSLNVKELRDTIRLDAVHMRGIGDMNTLDILKYFLAYSPTAIEWIDDSSCNILWTEMSLAVKALYYLSKAIVGSREDETLEETMDLDGQNNGLQNKHRVIEIRDEDDDKGTDKENIKEIHIRDVKEDIPEGSWRLGNESIKAKFILLRFALTTDKQPFRAEHFTEYYKQCGVIENGSKLGIISQSRKRKFLGIFDRNRDISSREDATSKDPWGSLAESWYQDYVQTEPEYKTPTLLTSNRLESVSNLQHRLGFKRAHLDSQNIEESVETANDETQEEVIEIHHSDLEETIASEEHTSRKLLEKRLKLKSPKKKKIKIPRMRMYADDEEVKIKRKKSLQSLKKKLSQKKKVVQEILVEEVVESNDLRNMIGKRTILKPKRRMENMVLVVKQEATEDEENSGRHMEDLGNKLKYRQMMRLSEAAAKNSVHLRLHGIQTVSTTYEDEDTYDVQEPEPEIQKRPIMTAIRTTSGRSTYNLIPRGGTLHSDNITPTTARNQSLSTASGQHHRPSARSPDRHHHDHHHHQRHERADRSDRDGGDERSGRHRDRDRTGGRMHSDRVEYHGRSDSRRAEYPVGDRGGRRHRKDVEEEEMERVERKGAKSKVMIVVKKPAQPTVASMAILPRPAANVNQSRPLSISTATLRAAHHRRHDNVRLTTRDSNRQSSSSSSSEDKSSSSSSTSTSDDDSSSDSGSDSDSDSSESSDTSDSDSNDDKRLMNNSAPKGGSVVRGARATIKDRMGITREEKQGSIRVQIKNEHYGK